MKIISAVIIISADLLLLNILIIYKKSYGFTIAKQYKLQLYGWLRIVSSTIFQFLKNYEVN